MPAAAARELALQPASRRDARSRARPALSFPTSVGGDSAGECAQQLLMLGPSPSLQAVLMLVNAIYFKGQWVNQFDK